MISSHRKQRLEKKEIAPRSFPWRQAYRKRLLMILLAPLLVLLLLMAMKGYYALRLQHALKECQRLGYPLRFEDYNAQHPPLPAEENAAPLLVESWELIQSDSAPEIDFYKLSKLYPLEELPAECGGDFRCFASGDAAWRGPVVASQGGAAFHFSVGSSESSKPFTKIGMLAERLLVEALFAVETGDLHGAQDRLKEAIWIVGGLLNEPIYPHAYRLTREIRAILDILMRLTSRAALDKQALAALSEALEALSYWETLQDYLDLALIYSMESLPPRSLWEEYQQGCFDEAQYQKYNSGYERRLRHLGSFKRYYYSFLHRIESEYYPPAPLARAVLRYFGLADCDRLNACRYHALGRDLLARDPRDALKAAQKACEEQRGGVKSASWVSREVMDIGDAFSQCARIEAYVRCCQVSLAIESYRRDHQEALPESLEALAPIYLSSIPRDPFHGEALRYRIEADAGYAVYSVGRDLKDDGGFLFDPKYHEWRNRSDDYVFLVQQ